MIDRLTDRFTDLCPLYPSYLVSQFHIAPFFLCFSAHLPFYACVCVCKQTALRLYSSLQKNLSADNAPSIQCQSRAFIFSLTFQIRTVCNHTCTHTIITWTDVFMCMYSVYLCVYVCRQSSPSIIIILLYIHLIFHEVLYMDVHCVPYVIHMHKQVLYRKWHCVLFEKKSCSLYSRYPMESLTANRAYFEISEHFGARELSWNAILDI